MDHLRAYITHVQDKVFPVGTGWEGLLRRKELQDRERPVGERYIRLMEELSLPNLHMLAGDDGDDEEDNTRFIQSDISYKRVAGFKELELVGWDEQSKTSVWMTLFTRILVTGFHLDIYMQIRCKIGLEFFTGLLIKVEGLQKLCTAHINRNIAKSKVPEHIKVKMRSLMCIKHPDWERTIQEIEQSCNIRKNTLGLGNWPTCLEELESTEENGHFFGNLKGIYFNLRAPQEMANS
ncbi:hypothetical protein C8R42DRAFT_637075 [Lentinula raphanica]|nr:hypothetical protein C8R42DRAFT_637075 [Lentinula raphanica]